MGKMKEGENTTAGADRRSAVPTVSAVLAVDSSGGGSGFNSFALDKATVAACPIEIDYVRSPWGIAHKKRPRIMKGRPFESKFSLVVAATKLTRGRSTL
jgi:hypothetical protein